MLAKCGRNRPLQCAEMQNPLAHEQAVREFSRARKALGWSQKQAASYLRVALVTVWRWECGEQKLPADALVAITFEAFGRCSIHQETGT